MAGTLHNFLERQERTLIQKINQAIKTNKGNPITLVSDQRRIQGIIKAEKYKKIPRSCTTEPYTDVILTCQTLKGIEKYNLSMKGETSPSLAGGGMCGIDLAVPGLVRKFMKMIYARLVVTLKPGDKVPDTFGRISKHDRVKIVVGSEIIGGPIHFMYIGPQVVQGAYDARKNELKVNGNLFDAEEYAEKNDLYFRLRARHADQRFDPTARDKMGVPKIYSGFPGRKDSPGRLVVTDWVTKMALVVQL